MTEQNVQYAKVSLFPGEVFIAEKPSVVWTLLGSCLAIIFHSIRHRVGAIAHSQLAQDFHMDQQCYAHCPHPCFSELSNANPFTYVSCSIRHLVNAFTERGIAPAEITVKLFGGASLIHSQQGGKTVGELNIEAAHRMLEGYELHIQSKHIGGDTGRTLYFYSDTGEVFLKRHKSSRIIPDGQGKKIEKLPEFLPIVRS